MTNPITKGRGKTFRWLADRAGFQGDECLSWPFARIRQRGYGILGHEGKHHYAHRLMCEMVNGPAPDDRPQASHSCGNGHLGCVNPRHLSWKSNAENQLDRRVHGTFKKNPNRMTAEGIAQARTLKGQKTIEEIAQMFRVKRGCIEYWLRDDKPLLRPGTCRTTLWKRRKEAGLVKSSGED